MNTQSTSWIMLTLVGALLALAAVALAGHASTFVVDAINADLARVAGR